jgi:transcriptional regulator NrdR family protein
MQCPECGANTRVVETRIQDEGCVLRRRRACSECTHRFNSYEFDQGLWGTIAKLTASHVKAVTRRRALTQRNNLILARLRAGEKHVTVAADFGLSDNMISTIARRAGVPTHYKRRNS